MMRRPSLALLGALALAGGAFAAEKYRYRFTAGKPLTYRTSLASEGSFTLPDGTPKTMKLAAQSTVRLTPDAPEGETWRLTSQTIRAQTTLDGTTVSAPKDATGSRTMTIRPDGTSPGALAAGGDDSTFAIAFPDRPLARGDRFTAERKAAAEGLPLKTTYTLVDTAATLPGHPGRISVFEARSELAAKSSRRLKAGGGKVWFDPAAGVLVKSELAYEFSEDAMLPGADKPSQRTTAIRYTSELER